MTAIAGILMGACFDSGMVCTPDIAERQTLAILRRLQRAGVGFTLLAHAPSLSPTTDYPVLTRNLAAADAARPARGLLVGSVGKA